MSRREARLTSVVVSTEVPLGMLQLAPRLPRASLSRLLAAAATLTVLVACGDSSGEVETSAGSATNPTSTQGVPGSSEGSEADTSEGQGEVTQGGGVSSSSTAGGPSSTSVGAETSAEADTGSTPGMGLAMRAACPEAPPAGPITDPVTDVYNPAVPQSTVEELILPQERFEGTRGSLPWHLYTPPQAEANADQRFPLILVLHGGNGRNVELGNVRVDSARYLLASDNGLLTEANREQYPAYIVAPHCVASEGCEFGSNEWASLGGAFWEVQPEPSVAGGTAIELVEHVIANYQVDPARVYVTGNSMGGGGTWEFVRRRPDLFAAGVPVSGHVPSLEDLDLLAASKVPVWAFTGENDTTNPRADTEQAVSHLEDAGGCAWITQVSGAGHDDVLWANPYLYEGLWPWLFAQRIPSVGDPDAGEPWSQ